ncbi:MAG: GNAT family N-acetyltransferase [Eubacteriales bacterium]|nr:GNAT family N-acetyltransferase [Eubacteriales bacterium]
MTQQMRRMRREELPGIYRLVKEDFPPAEYPPRVAMERHMRRKAVRGYVLEQDGAPAAYAFVAHSGAGQPALLVLYAVSQRLRGQGLGSAFLRALLDEYAAASRLYIEVERPELAADADEQALRRRRVSFYQRLDFMPLPGVDYTIFGVPMRLYAHPLGQAALPDNDTVMREMRSIYAALLPAAFRHNLVMFASRD